MPDGEPRSSATPATLNDAWREGAEGPIGCMPVVVQPADNHDTYLTTVHRAKTQDRNRTKRHVQERKIGWRTVGPATGRSLKPHVALRFRGSVLRQAE